MTQKSKREATDLEELEEITADKKKETAQAYAKRLGVPLIPKRSRRVFRAEQNPVMAVCEECGQGIRREDEDTCTSSECPIHPRRRLSTKITSKSFTQST